MPLVGYAVEPLIVDFAKIGHSMMHLSTKDTTSGPSVLPTIHFEPPKDDNYLSTNNNSTLSLYKVCSYPGGK